MYYIKFLSCQVSIKWCIFLHDARDVHNAQAVPVTMDAASRQVSLTLIAPFLSFFFFLFYSVSTRKTHNMSVSVADIFEEYVESRLTILRAWTRRSKCRVACIKRGN